jgi:integrase
MSRTPKPWLRKGRGWYVKIDGAQVPLGRDRAAAHAAFHRLMADRAAGVPGAGRSAGLTVLDVVNLYLAEQDSRARAGEIAPGTAADSREILCPFARDLGHGQATGLRPYDVARWRDRPTWGPTQRHRATGEVKRAFRWARKAGLIDANPIAELEAPAPRRRSAIPAPGQVDRLRAAIAPGDPFADLLRALYGSGARPGEVYGLTAAGVDLAGRRWLVRNKTRRKTGVEERAIYLTPELVELSRALCERRPDGPLFVNAAGRPWTNAAVSARLTRLRKRLGMGREVCAYAIRHLFATDALEKGVPIATVAELMGHSDTTMVSRVYSKLGQRQDHLRASVDFRRAVSPGPSGENTPRPGPGSAVSGPEGPADPPKPGDTGGPTPGTLPGPPR